MRILIASTYVTSEKGGAERVAWDMANYLAKSHEVHVLTLSKEPEKLNNAKIHILPDVPKPTVFYSTIGWNYIKKLLSEHEFDVIHSHMSLPWGYIFRNAKSKKIITLHGCEYLNEDRLYRIFAKKAFKKSDLIVSPSHWLRDYVKDNYGYDPLVINNGINTSKFKIFKDIKREKKVVLFVGRLTEIKGVRELIEVAKELKDYEFWFIGEGELKSLINLPNTKHLGYFNHSTGSRLVEMYNRATICVFPSYKENFPMVALEALSCGKPVIATQTGFSEIIDHNENGFLISPKDQGELKSAIITLMENEDLREKFEKNARKKALKYDWSKIVKKYCDAYEELLK